MSVRWCVTASVPMRILPAARELKRLLGGSPCTLKYRMAFSLSRPSRRSRSASRAVARVWTAALRHALPRVRAIRPYSSREWAMSGRRKLTEKQIAAILEWNRNRKTRAELAAELGVAKHLVGSAIYRRGIYKCPSPENRERNLRERRALMERLKERALL